MVIDRAAGDTLALRLDWRGRATSEIARPITVGSVSELSRSSEMEAAIIERVHAGESDETIAAAEPPGHCSALRATVLPGTVQVIRLRQASCANAASRIRAASPAALPFPHLRPGSASPRTGSMTAFTTARLPSNRMPGQVSMCSRTARRPCARSRSSKPSSWSASPLFLDWLVEEGSIMCD